jgi:hypothetical protein
MIARRTARAVSMVDGTLGPPAEPAARRAWPAGRLRIARFERARAWPHDPDLLIDSYAQLCDLAPREIWQAAINAWND